MWMRASPPEPEASWCKPELALPPTLRARTSLPKTLPTRSSSSYENRLPAKTAVVIPARYASTRFPGKPLFPLAGKPMIQHVWERCMKAKGVEQVIVATEDMRIAEAAFAFGAEVALTSDKCRSGTDRVAEVAKKLRGFTHVINVQGDEPLVDPTTVTKLAKAMAASRDIEMITSA